MKRQDVLAMVYDFVGLLISRISEGKIRSIILFGSVARDDFDSSSDVDIFVDSPFAIEKEVQQAEKSFEVIKRRVWSLKGISLPLKVICGNLSAPQWSSLKDEIEGEGIVLFGSLQPQSPGTPSLLVSYDLGSLDQPQKVKLLRKLHGYTIKKEGKVYPQKGLVELEGGTRIGSNVFMVPAGSRRSVEARLKECKADYQIRKVTW